MTEGGQSRGTTRSGGYWKDTLSLNSRDRHKRLAPRRSVHTRDAERSSVGRETVGGLPRFDRSNRATPGPFEVQRHSLAEYYHHGSAVFATSQ